MIIFLNWISWRLVGLGRTAVRQSTFGPTTTFSTTANRRGSKPPIPIVTSSMIRPLGLRASGFPRTTLYCTNARRTRRTSSAAIISRWECRLHLSELFKSVSLLLLRNLNFSTDLFIQGNRRSSSRVMLTLYSVNMKSVTHPCADRLIFRDFKNDLTILDVNANRLKATGNYTSTRGKGYLCQLQFQVVFNTIPNEDIQMQLYLWYILFARWEMSLYPPEYFRRRPICWPLSTSMRYVPLHFISNPVRPCSTADTISFTHCIFADLPALMSQSTASLTYRKWLISARYQNNVHDFCWIILLIEIGNTLKMKIRLVRWFARGILSFNGKAKELPEMKLLH